MRAFSTSNSACVRMPCSFMSASRWSSARSGPSLCAGAGAAYCCCSYCGSSCAAQRFAWRRDTRFETAVAVPATTAVRATPRMSPGMMCPLSLLERVERLGDGGERNVSRGDELGVAVAKRLHEVGGPAILEDQDRGGRARLDRRARVVE